MGWEDTTQFLATDCFCFLLFSSGYLHGFLSHIPTVGTLLVVSELSTRGPGSRDAVGSSLSRPADASQERGSAGMQDATKTSRADQTYLVISGDPSAKRARRAIRCPDCHFWPPLSRRDWLLRRSRAKSSSQRH